MNAAQVLLAHALNLMKSHGYVINDDVGIEVDEKLQIMGYTTEKNGRSVIVISQWSMNTPMVMGLLIHEMSHIYRIESKHPSHDFILHNRVLEKTLRGELFYPYQIEIIRNCINNLQDIYADDLSFSIIENDLKISNMNEFFMGWIQKPIILPETQEDRWKLAAQVVNAAFAQANLQRHKVADNDQKVENAIKGFLKDIPQKYQKQFDYFRKLMVELPDKVTEDEFAELLDNYIRSFIKLTTKA